MATAAATVFVVPELSRASAACARASRRFGGCPSFVSLSLSIPFSSILLSSLLYSLALVDVLSTALLDCRLTMMDRRCGSQGSGRSRARTGKLFVRACRVPAAGKRRENFFAGARVLRLILGFSFASCFTGDSHIYTRHYTTKLSLSLRIYI